MKGQWIGRYKQDNFEGSIMINIDEMDGYFDGLAYLCPDEYSIPRSCATIRTNHKKQKQNFTSDVFPVDPNTGLVCEWDKIEKKYDPPIDHAETADVEVNETNGKLNISAKTNLNSVISATVEKSPNGGKSSILGVDMNWEDFKKDLADKKNKNILFRGQQKDWPLMTSFHRGDRYNLYKFIDNHIKELHRRLSNITSHYFDLSDPEQSGAFYNLLQHHGYPTPLLDWSYSPYVAAFFAFRDWEINYNKNEKVRIYVFDNESWKKSNNQAHNLCVPIPHFTANNLLAIDNPRSVPQQSVTTLTNIYDIERHIKLRERSNNTSYLKAIDIPANQRQEVMSDLQFMGITAGSMFPGIDGICEELKELNFR